MFKIENVVMILILLGSLMNCSAGSLPAEEKTGICSCAGIKAGNAELKLEHAFEMVTGCSNEAAIGCQFLCNALGEAIRLSGNGPKLVCSLLKDTNANPAFHTNFKVCDNSYAPTGMSYVTPTCCKGGEIVACQ